MDSVQTSGEWREERLYVLRTIEAVQQEQRRQAEQAAILGQTQVVKAQKDINNAHERIRGLEGAARILKIKNWIMTAVLSTVVVLLVEYVKNLLK